MSFLSAIIISNLRQSGDPKMLELANHLERDQVQEWLKQEDEFLKRRPLADKLIDGDDLTGFYPRVIHNLTRLGIISRR